MQTRLVQVLPLQVQPSQARTRQAQLLKAQTVRCGQGCGRLWYSLLLGVLTLAQSQSATAQSLPACQPPRANEYLLLVPNPQPDTQSQIQKLLPANAVLTPCNYLDTPVVRVEGFASAEIATAWAQYLSDGAGVQSYVARPANATIASTPSPTPNAGGTSSPVAPAAANAPANPAVPSAATPTYNPQPLGLGYAVVVQYFNQPELANRVRQITSQDVGLVAFEQQPYLLASYTTDPAVASSWLRTLSERGLTASIVDSRRTVLLTPAVKLGS